MRRAITAWQSLAVRDEEDLHVLVNKVSKQNIFPHSAVSKLTSATVLQSFVPSMFRYLEPSLNARDPREVTETAWWKVIRLIGGELGVAKATSRGLPTGPGPAQSPAGAGGDQSGGDPPASESRSAWTSRGRRVAAEKGSIAVENVALIPVVMLICVLVWQLCLTGMTFIWSGLASAAAAREYSMTYDQNRVKAAAAERVPGWLAKDMDVSYSDPDAVVVSIDLPLLFPGAASLPSRISSKHVVVREP
jgi:pilus assembly protein CpaE